MKSFYKFSLTVIFLFIQSYGGLNLIKDNCRSEMWYNSYSGYQIPFHYHSYSISPSSKWVLEIIHYYGSNQNYPDSVPVNIFQYCYPAEQIYVTTIFPAASHKLWVRFGEHEGSDGLYQRTWNPNEDTVYFQIHSSTANSKTDTVEVFYIDVSSITKITTNSAQSINVHPLLKARNYPNPFKSETEIEYSLPNDGFVSINIYNSKGELVIVLGQKLEVKGDHSIKWDGKNNLGNTISNGTYYYQIISGNNISVKKMLLLK
jgi:hypothetical protein